MFTTTFERLPSDKGDNLATAKRGREQSLFPLLVIGFWLLVTEY